MKTFSIIRKMALMLFTVVCVGSVMGAVITNAIYDAENVSVGYKVTGLGDGYEVAMVFTNHTKEIVWTVPASIKSAQFLVVGGGGGGGADVYDDAAAGGAGGGGGGVVVGEVDIAKNAEVAVTVGAGGAGGQLATNQRDGASSGTYYGASRKGGNSVLKVGGTTYVTAYGGGRDQGTTKRNSSSLTTSNMKEGGQGGSNAGSRGGITAAQSKNPQMGAVASNAALRNCTTYGNKGGKGCSTYFYGYPSAGGGGGATEAGGDAGNNDTGWPGGKGGEGLASDITGTLLVYGSGGGGASTQGESGGIGGSGAGDGGDRGGSQGTSALANQGGGGGGSSRESKFGGNGGSGIVVIRYRQLIYVDALEEDFIRTYTGDIQTIKDAYSYTVSGEVSATNVGEYSITVIPHNGYRWADTETDAAREFTWKIIQAINEWISDASITKTTWTIGIDEAGDVTPPVAKFGEVKAMISKNGGEEVEFDGTIPNESGKYVVTYYPAESTTNFTSEEMTLQSLTFKVFSLEDIPEYSIIVSESSDIGANRKVIIPYEVTCEAISIKTLNLYVCYSIVGEALTKTNFVSAIEGVKGSGNCEISDLKPGAEYQVSFYGDIEGTLSQLTEPITTAMVPSSATNLEVSSVTFVNDPMEFRIEGSVIPGLGTTVVKVYWALNDASQLETNTPKQFEYSIGDIIDGDEVEFGKSVEFKASIPYTSLSDKLIWKVEVENSLVTDTWGEQTFAGPTEQAEKERLDAGAITYTWTGGGTPNENGLYKWADIRNWTPNDTTKECLGYPGTISGTQSKAIFTKDAKVDLNGSKMYIDGAIQMNEGISVEISNGTLGSQKTSVTLGAANSILTLKAVKLPFSASKPTDKYTIIPAASSMVVIDGDNSMDYTVYTHLKYSPTTTGKLLIKNFDGRIGYDSVAAVKDSVGELSNAKWDFFTGSGNTNTGLADKGLPMKLIFIDGEDRRAVLRSLWSFSWDDDYSKINLNGRTLDIKLKVDPTSDYHNANIMASMLSQNANCTINIDVTDYKYTKPVKILTLHSGLGDKELTYTLNVTAKGVDVTERVKAKLYWDDGKKNLYFSQSAAGMRVIVR